MIVTMKSAELRAHASRARRVLKRGLQEAGIAADKEDDRLQR